MANPGHSGGRAKRWAVPFGSVPGAKNLALSPRRRSVFPRKFLTRYSGRIHPWLREVLGELAYVLISAGRYDEADGLCQKLPADFPGRSVCLARARLGQGRIDEAIQVLGTAVGSDRSPQ